MAQTDQILSTLDVARILGVSSESVRLYANRGLLPAMRTPNGRRVFLQRDVEKLKAERAKNPPQVGRPKKKARKVTRKTTTKKRSTAKKA